MTIPTPAVLTRISPAVPVVIDTRCGKGLVPRDGRLFVCTRKGGHTGKHIDCRHNMTWTDER